MTDLLTFGRAQLDKDERMARATTGPWKYHHETGGVVLPTARHVPDLAEIVSTPREPSDARHMVRWDSARVLREVEAKRQLLNAHYDYQGVCPRCFDSSNKSLQREKWPCEAVRLCVLPYADHPDYDKGWRP